MPLWMEALAYRGIGWHQLDPHENLFSPLSKSFCICHIVFISHATIVCSNQHTHPPCAFTLCYPSSFDPSSLPPLLLYTWLQCNTAQHPHDASSLFLSATSVDVVSPLTRPPLHAQRWILCGSGLLIHQLFSSFGIHTILILACVSPHFSDFCACLTCPVLFRVYLFLSSFSPLSCFPLTLRSFLCSSLSNVFIYLLLDSKVSDGHL